MVPSPAPTPWHLVWSPCPVRAFTRRSGAPAPSGNAGEPACCATRAGAPCRRCPRRLFTARARPSQSVKSSIIEPQDALVNAAFLWALRSANAPASRAGTPASRSSTPLQRCRCSRCAREGRLRASESMGDRGRQRHALASCLVSMPRARIHAEIRRTGAFGQRGGTRLLRHTRGGAMPLVRGPQTPKRIVAGRSRINECARPMRCRAADRGLRTRRARSSPC